MRIGSALRLMLAASLLWCGLTAWAQSFDLDRGREPVVSLDGQWRFHPGDSPMVDGRPAWAEPVFDDAKWPLITSSEPWSAQGYANLSGFAWYRFDVKVRAGEGPTSLLLAPIWSSYQVYVDGLLVGRRGPMPPTRLPSSEYSFHMFPLTTDASAVPRDIHVALRMWHAPIWADYVGGGPLVAGNLAGDPKLLLTERLHREIQRNSAFVDAYSYSIITAIVGITILCLFLIRPAEREYLWFACLMLAQCADNVLNVGEQIFYWFPTPVFDLLDASLVALIICSFLLFFSRILESSRGKVGRILQLLAALSAPAAVLYWPGWASPAASASIQIMLLLPAVGWILWTLVRCAVRGNPDARLLLIPALLDIGFYFADNLAIVLAQAGLTHMPRVFEVDLPLPPFSIHTGTLLHLIFLLALLVFLIRRFSLARKREERMATEFEAAREVQQMLLPDELDQCPAYRVDSIYRPADEVGGDFFQQIADGSGGILIVVGDVSGKGLSAALIVSVLVGAIRSEAAHGSDPATTLSALNDRLARHTRGGFVTCMAAHLSAEGMMTIANAGHLPPYLNGEELGAAPSLPLGLIDGMRYETSKTQLQPGDRLTFVSDGVVEAQARGGELFGFERTRAMSREPAETIADAAQRFGQEDDITVVTVEFRGAATVNPAESASSEQGLESHPATA